MIRKLNKTKNRLSAKVRFGYHRVLLGLTGFVWDEPTVICTHPDMIPWHIGLKSNQVRTGPGSRHGRP
ncbi:hypothetical protein SUGI_0629580 [Cryptomeria japonica]|nr:hypothetical protein SUGI_0629580 [Cryptomeria japonica]